MEEQVERKEAASTASKEPVKTEGLVPSPDTSERSEGASSPPPNCSICLGKLKNTSFTDSCLHQFCFTCLLQWSKIKTECPLCKQTFKSIIHNVRSEEDYDQYHVPRDLASQLPSSQLAASLDVGLELVAGIADVGIQRFVYRTTMTPNRRYNMLLNPEQVARREQIPNMLAPSVSREERRYRLLNPSSYRRNVYQHGEWSNLIPDIYGRFRECSAEYYRRHPNQLTRLVPWINRELQILLNANEPYIAYVLGVITDALVSWDIRSAEFRNTLRPYFASYTDHFAHELLNYARSSFDLVGYDQYVTYPTHGRGFSNEYIGRVISPTSSSRSTSSDDSDIRILDQTIDVSRAEVEAPSVGPHVIDMPGPSTVAEAFQVPQMGSGRPDILTISSSCSSSEECEVVGYVKPRHERTPEIIELESSDDVEEPANNCDTNSCRTPIQCEEESDRPGPSSDERRRSVRESGSRRLSRLHRWSTSSGSSTNCNADPEYCHRRRKKSSSYSGIQRPRTRNYTRNARTSGPSESHSPLRSRSGTRRNQASSSPHSIDNNERHISRKSVRDRGQTSRQRCSTTMTLLSRSESSSSTTTTTTSSSGSSSSSSSSSSRGSSNNRKIRAAITVEIRKALKMKKRLEKKSLSSESESTESVELSSRRRRRARRSASIYDSASDNAKSLPMRSRRQPVNATILRKDATNPDEWYVKNRKTSRGRGRNRSSSSSLSLTSSSSSPQRKLPVCNKYKHRRETSLAAGASGCKRNGEREASTRTNSGSEVSCRSNSRCSAVSGRTRAKELSKRKEGIRKRKVRSGTSESSDSGRSKRVDRSTAGASDTRRTKRRVEKKRTDHDRKKICKGTETKRKSQARSEEKSGRIDHSRKKDEPSKSNDHDKRSDHGRKIADQPSKSNGGSRKKERQRNDDQPGTSKHSDNEKRSVSKDKHKRKKKQKTKRRRSRSELKTESRNSRHRKTRSSSYSAPTTNHDDP